MSGILVIVSIAVGVLILGFVGHLVIDRLYLKRSRQSEIFRGKPHRRGRVGRIR